MLANGYQHDLFLSYSRKGNSYGWVHNHFYPLLRDSMTDLLPGPPAIFIDKNIDVGARWPTSLAAALKRSRILVAVWSGPYFYSPWCTAELRSMLRRGHCLGMGSEENPITLIYPVVFADGDSFPPEARAIQARMDLRKWAYSQPQFKDTAMYLEFQDVVKVVADELVQRLANAPPWQADWPTVRPRPRRLVAPPLPRLE